MIENFWRAGTRLDLEQLLFNTPILITPRKFGQHKPSMRGTLA
jgi:hypothetical protein